MAVHALDSVPWEGVPTKEAFLAPYDRLSADLTPAQRGVILAEVSAITDPELRLFCVSCVLDDNPSVTECLAGRNTALHCMLGAARHNFAEEAQLIKRMLDMGADLNARNSRGQAPLDLVLLVRALSEEDLLPIYQVAFDWARLPGPDGHAHGLAGGAYRPGSRPIYEAEQAKLRSLISLEPSAPDNGTD